MDPGQPKKWYANAKSTGDITLRKLGKEIAARCTVRSADTQAVLVALTELLVEHLSDEEIKGSKVNFRPGIDLKEMQNNLKFEKF